MPQFFDYDDNGRVTFNTEKDPYQLIYDACEAIRTETRMLRHKVDALATVGLTSLAGEIHLAVTNILAAERIAHGAVGKWIAEEARTAERMSGTLLKAALVGAFTDKSEQAPGKPHD